MTPRELCDRVEWLHNRHEHIGLDESERRELREAAIALARAYLVLEQEREAAYRAGAEAERERADRLRGFAESALTLARDAHTHLMEERPEDCARMLHRAIQALAAALRSPSDAGERGGE